MGFYLFIILILVIFSIVKPKGLKGRNLLILAILFFYVIATIRAEVIGNDTASYSYYFDQFRKGIWNSDYEYEIGYYWISRLFGIFTKNFNVFLVFVNAAIYYAYYRLIRDYSSNYGLSLLLFLCLEHWGHTVNILRQEIAVCLFIYAFLLTDRGKRIQGLFISVLAPFFQRTSLTFFLMYFIPNKIEKRFYAVFGSLGVIMLLVIDKIVIEIAGHVSRFQKYFMENTNESKYVLGRVEPAIVARCVFLLIVWVLAWYIYDKNKEKTVCTERITAIELQINMVFMAMLIVLMAARFNILERCALFFDSFVIVLIPNMISMIKKDEFRHVTQAAFTVIAVGYFVAVNVFRPEWNHIYPYRMFFQSPN